MSVSRFPNDLFISYAHIDNQALSPDQRGWIDEFHRCLEIRLQQLLGEKPEIWRDPKLQGNDYVQEEIVSRFSEVAILVSVLSPRYVKSEWCMKELDGFLHEAEAKGELKIGTKSRVFKIIKTHLPLDEHPEPLQKLLGYEFYQYDDVTGRAREFWGAFGPEASRRFYAKLDDVAWDVKDLLSELASTNGRHKENGKQKPAATIYLATTTTDLNDEYQKLRREFVHRGYCVLPEETLPMNGKRLREQVKQDLEQSLISIHLVGGKYASIPEEETASNSFIQKELAAEQTRRPNFHQIVWLPVELEISDSRQEEWVETLRNSDPARQNFDLLQTPLEELKTFTEDKIKHLLRPAKTKPSGESPAHIYLIHDHADEDAVQPLNDFLFDSGFEVLRTYAEEDESDFHKEHIENLTICDAVVIYFGQVTERWVRSKLRDLIKTRGYGRETPLDAKMIYIDDDGSPGKQRFRTHEAEVVRAKKAFSPEALTSFIADLRNGDGRRS